MTHAVLTLLACLAALLFVCVVIILLMVILNRKNRHPDQALAEDGYLIVYASQSGQVESFAVETLKLMQQAGESVQMLNIQHMTEQHLLKTRKILWMISTYGEGDAPDTAQNFVQTVMPKQPDLSHLSFALLAFGDSRYSHFCQFGQQLNQWLLNQKAQPLFDLVSVNQLSQADLATWIHHLEQLIHHDLSSMSTDRNWVPVQLVKRELLNAGSQGNPLYHLEFTSEELQWQAGDILEVRCANTASAIETFLSHHQQETNLDAVCQLRFKNLRKYPEAYKNESFLNWVARFDLLASRDYSIASIPEQQKIELVVRQEITSSGLGLGSGWLTQGIETGQFIDVAVRHNPGFHAELDTPMILIGNGSGIAGLLSHLHQQEIKLSFGHWLIFGEREKNADTLFQSKLNSWKNNGTLAELDLVFSRDDDELKYVQDVLYQKSEQLKTWVEQGAAIYVCGSIKGMAQGVEKALVEILGAETVHLLKKQKRYKRDVY